MKALNYDIEAIEAAFLAAVQPLKTERLVRTLDTYGGQLDVDDLETLTPLFPAVYVIWGGVLVQSYGSADGLSFGVSYIVCDRNLRGARAAREGDSRSSGVYHLLGRIRALVHGKNLVSEWYQPFLVRERPLAYDPKKSVAVYEASYELRRRT